MSRPHVTAAATLILLFASAPAAADVRDLLGTKTAIQCYHVGNDVRCRNLSTDDDWMVFTRPAGTDEGWAGSLNQDGTKLTCMDGTQLAVINLDGSNHERVTDPNGAGSGLLWRDAQGNDWVYYIGEPVDKSQAGTTWRVQIDPDTNAAIESTRDKLVDFQYHAGVNGSGKYLGTTYRNAYMYNLDTQTQSPHLNEFQNCVGTMNAGPEPWMFYEMDPPHHDLVISEWNEQANSARYIWHYHDAANEIFGQWSSTDPDYAVIGKGDNDELWLIKLQVDVSGSGDNTGSYEEAAMGISHYVGRLWVGDNTAPQDCTGGLTRCNGACVNTNTDSQNCGSCDNACTTDQQCEAGSCESVGPGSDGGTSQPDAATSDAGASQDGSVGADGAPIPGAIPQDEESSGCACRVGVPSPAAAGVSMAGLLFR